MSVLCIFYFFPGFSSCFTSLLLLKLTFQPLYNSIKAFENHKPMDFFSYFFWYLSNGHNHAIYIHWYNCKNDGLPADLLRTTKYTSKKWCSVYASQFVSSFSATDSVLKKYYGIVMLKMHLRLKLVLLPKKVY